MVNPNQDARGGNGKYTRSLTTAKRDAEAANLRSKGYSYTRIAETLGYSDRGSAHHAVKRVLELTVQEAGEELRQVERERLDRLSEAAWAVLERQHVTVSNGRIVSLDGQPLPDDAPVLAAIDRLLRISESRRKLEGLDAPTKTHVSGGVKYEVVGVSTEDLM